MVSAGVLELVVASDVEALGSMPSDRQVAHLKVGMPDVELLLSVAATGFDNLESVGQSNARRGRTPAARRDVMGGTRSKE